VFQSRPIRVFRDDFPAAPDDDVAVAEVMRGRARGALRQRSDVRVGCSFVKFLCCPGAMSPLRTVIAISDRMPEIGR
jgi:hypothetical protein